MTELLERAQPCRATNRTPYYRLGRIRGNHHDEVMVREFVITAMHPALRSGVPPQCPAQPVALRPRVERGVRSAAAYRQEKGAGSPSASYVGL